MKIVEQLTNSRHTGLVFINHSAAAVKDLTQAIGIISQDGKEISFAECEAGTAPEVDKMRALLAAGFMPTFAKLSSGNYYVCQKAEASSVTECIHMNEAINEANVSTDLPNNSVTDPAPVKTKRPVVYKRKVIGMYNEATDELEIDDEYHAEDHDYLLLEPCDETPYWEVEDDSLEQVLSIKNKTVKESKLVTESGQIIVTEACSMAIAASKFLNY